MRISALMHWRALRCTQRDESSSSMRCFDHGVEHLFAPVVFVDEIEHCPGKMRPYISIAFGLGDVPHPGIGAYAGGVKYACHYRQVARGSSLYDDPVHEECPVGAYAQAFVVEAAVKHPGR